ncbi:DEAD/DEAH box helicase family protein [Halalkalibacter alkaliphilus]|uniref:type I site-specific deoxyribonuclease n=1 Tax=Halalkalibacter alkaliphilus TaxID=2917993 RepID=A0A9X2CRW9_9BACI|nr:DEAD/DEAH box helicase family protein [Halalkalibacter alkaliphilus]MCL7747044.1 DEAD/DEAH box helicase family protein [Halalkalibacter alkaliphilus]
MIHNEDSRVKLPVILHFIRLGYKYQSKKGAEIDNRNNIFVDVFKESIRELNSKDYSDNVLEGLIKEIADLTDNTRDKGKAFFEKITTYSQIKLIDFNRPERNDFRVVSELRFKGEREEFRPDITILINGIPIGFLEVKKPNNQNGVQAEFSRMRYRLGVQDFLHFFNQFQVIGFSNNMPYDDDSRIKLQGSFYTTPNGTKASFNNFREENEIAVNDFIAEDLVEEILLDNNLISIKDTNEFKTNLRPDTHANKFVTSLFSIERLVFFIKYGIVYVDSKRAGLEKHIMRYPQYFAIKELEKKLSKGMRRGVIWHTQGSGKTALAFFSSNVLRDYFQKQKKITKFYFVVDRLDLLFQASDEFSSRGMTIANIDSKEAFAKNLKSPVVASTSSQTMNVINIQKFSEDSTVELELEHDIQRIYFLDEVHRGYKPKGTFLANLLGADPNGIYIGLTGTPILKEEFKTTDLFDSYIHKYYYNKSIADGYTLKIKKEDIATYFKRDVRRVLDMKEDEKISKKEWEVVTQSDQFVDTLCKYIEDDFEQFKEIQEDPTLGFMIVSSSSEQARKIQDWFTQEGSLKTALVLYDEEGNKDKQEEFRGKRNKENNNEIQSEYSGVIVYNMLLTGFDASRLKRLYLLRENKKHSLLQTLARVNRPYKKLKYGYIVDFVDITEEYEETNRRYLEELKEDIGEDGNDIEEIFIDKEKVKEKIVNIENALFSYDLSNLEMFQSQLQPLNENVLREIKASLTEYKECYNELRMAHEDVSDIPIERISKALIEVSNRINLKVAERVLDDDDNDNDITDVDLQNLIIEFLRVNEIDLAFTTENDILERVTNVRNAFSSNNDQDDDAFIELQNRYKEIVRSFRNETSSTHQITQILKDLDALYNDILILSASNNTLTSRYNGDDAYMRIHKRIKSKYREILSDLSTFEIMKLIIKKIDELIGNIHQPTQNIIFRELKRPVRDAFKEKGIAMNLEEVEDILYLFTDYKFKQG